MTEKNAGAHEFVRKVRRQERFSFHFCPFLYETWALGLMFIFVKIGEADDTYNPLSPSNFGEN